MSLKQKYWFLGQKENWVLMINGIIMGMSSRLLIFPRTLVWYFLTQQGCKAMFSLRSKLKRFVDINSVVYCDLFNKMVMPVLLYGCEIWGFYPAKAIEQVHKELGRIPLLVQIYIRIMKYWLKNLNIKQTRFTKVLYNVQFNALTNNHTIENWVSKVRNLLCSYGFGEAWYNQRVGDVNICLVFLNRGPLICIFTTGF